MSNLTQQQIDYGRNVHRQAGNWYNSTSARQEHGTKPAASSAYQGYLNSTPQGTTRSGNNYAPPKRGGIRRKTNRKTRTSKRKQRTSRKR